MGMCLNWHWTNETRTGALKTESKIIKKELAYFGILAFSSFLIYQVFGKAFSDVYIGENSEPANVFLLTLNHYLYLLAGVLLLGFTVYIYMHLRAYLVGKLFALYLTLITSGICLAAAANYRNKGVNFCIGSLLYISNVVLFYLIGRLTLTVRRKSFRCFLIAYLLLIFTVAAGTAYMQIGILFLPMPSCWIMSLRLFLFL